MTIQSGVGSLCVGNILKHNGATGLFVVSANNVEVGPNQYIDNTWVNNAGSASQVSLSGATNCKITGGRAWITSAGTSIIGLKIVASTTGCKVLGFDATGHSSGDIYIDNSLTAGANQVLDPSGTIIYQATTNGQQLRYTGTGAPALPASVGSTYTRQDGSSGTTLYVKESGNGTTGWDAMVSGGGGLSYGNRVAYASSNGTPAMSAVTTSSTLTSMIAVSNAPSITLPNDGHTYRVTLSAASIQVNIQQPAAIGLGTTATTILKYTFVGFSGELEAPCYVQIDVVASGQTIGCYAYAASGGTVTIAAAANAPAELSAVLVAT
jgi:hypothetical protein